MKLHSVLCALLALTSIEPAFARCQLPKGSPEFHSMLREKRKLLEVKETAIVPDPKGGSYSTRLCRLSRLSVLSTDPVDKSAREVRAIDYKPLEGDPALARTVILLPPTGGENTIDRLYSELLCRAGIRVFLLQGWSHDDLVEPADLSGHDRAWTRGISAIEDLLVYISPKHENQVGILGTSLGAIGSSLLLGVDSRVNTGVLIVGGSGIPEIIANSQERRMTSLREKRNAIFGFKSVAEYQAALENAIQIEPENYLRWAKPKRVLTMVATRDNTVPTENQNRLHRLLGSQESRALPFGHIGAILRFSLNERRTIVNYFEKNLSEATGNERPIPQNDVCSNQAR